MTNFYETALYSEPSISEYLFLLFSYLGSYISFFAFTKSFFYCDHNWGFQKIILIMVVLFKLTVFESQTLDSISLLQQSLVTVRNVYSVFSKTRTTINKPPFMTNKINNFQIIKLVNRIGILLIERLLKCSKNKRII